MRVLIADDSAIVRRTIERRLEGSGIDVVAFDSCASASAADATTLACALLDFDLGDGYGVDVAVRLRAAMPELPIAFFTSTTVEDVAARTAPFGTVFVKPAELDRAIAWVETQASLARVDR